jgi:hypothetical protein
MIAMEATTFTGWIYDHLLPRAEKMKVAHPLMLREHSVGRRLAHKEHERSSKRSKTDELRERLLG